MPYKVVLIFEPAGEISVQFKWRYEQYFPVVLFAILCKVVLNLYSLDTKSLSVTTLEWKVGMVLSRGPNIWGFG